MPKVGQGIIGRTIPGTFSVSESFDVGVDNGGSVERKAYTSPFKFSDTLNWVCYDTLNWVCYDMAPPAAKQ